MKLSQIPKYKFKDGLLYHGDCLKIMKYIPDGYIDMILCDLPYETTACEWDTLIPFEPLWKEYWRVLKPKGAVVLFGAEPFSSNLRMSQIQYFKYDWIWIKSRPVSFTTAKLKPMNKHEVISVFSQGTTANRSPNLMPYYPQDLRKTKIKKEGHKAGKNNYHRLARPSHRPYTQEYTNYPSTVLQYDSVEDRRHPTQKPIPLCEYLIRTYTKENEIILDNCIGSGTTAIAAMHCNRRFIGIEKDKEFFELAASRIKSNSRSLWS